MMQSSIGDVEYNNNRLYDLVEMSRWQFVPLRASVVSVLDMLEQGTTPLSNQFLHRQAVAGLEIVERLTRRYIKPSFGITSAVVNGHEYHVEEKTILHKPFCNLVHFYKQSDHDLGLPKLIIVAPMAGHFATLLRNTVTGLLPHFDVYITDWIDAAQVPLAQGNFTLDDYIDYLLEFFTMFNEKVNVLAVCQPTVPTLAATAIMSSEHNPLIPKSLVLVGGPVDARRNLTKVNSFALEHNIEWFKKYMITTVPMNYPGAGRQVFPGFLQLSGFISLNLRKHIDAHMELYHNLLSGSDEEADVQTKFYDEYLSVMDLPAEFYLQTIQEVFQEFSLARDKFVSRGRKIEISKIKGISILGIEGEKDDIAAVGQTLAALDLCVSVPSEKKRYHLQDGAGHYGIFSGSKFKQHIVPVITDFLYNA